MDADDLPDELRLRLTFVADPLTRYGHEPRPRIIRLRMALKALLRSYGLKASWEPVQERANHE